jgi:hypothetical protein
MVDFRRLECKTGGHNKFYELWMEQKGSSDYWFVNFKYGAIGTSGLSGSKTPTAMMKHLASGIYNKLLTEKLGKGYSTVKEGSKALPKSMQSFVEEKAKKKTMSDYLSVGLMMPTKDVLENLEAYTKNGDWMFQQKLNGQFCRIFWTGIGKDEPIAFNKTGGIVELNDEISSAVRKAGKAVILDGELINGAFHAVDALRIGTVDLEHVYADLRFDALSGYVSQYQGAYIHFVQCGLSEDAKRELVKHLQDNSQEGVVIKLKAAKYEAGKASMASKAVSVKIKFWKEVSALMLKWNDKNSIQVAVREKVGMSHKTLNVGNVTVPEKYKNQIKDAGEGCIVRVRYLFATAANKLYQPTLDPDDDGNVVRDDVVMADTVDDLIHEGDVKGEPMRQITL